MYQGDFAGDQLGSAVAIVGDVIGGPAKDVALGAPFADPNARTDAGIVYVHEGAANARGIIDVCVFGSATSSLNAAQIQGDQPGMELGFSIADGGDNQVDGTADLLMGAPKFDVTTALETVLTNAGAVFQTSSRFGKGIIDVCASVGTTIDGAQWMGESGGDELGTAVAGLGDVNGDGYDDIALGAPHADPNATTDAGAVYLIDGGPVADPTRGAISVSTVGGTTPGQKLVGTEAGEQAGTSIAGTGDLDGGGTGDFVVGSPHRDEQAQTDAGTVYIVSLDDTDQDGTPNRTDCSAANGQAWAIPSDVRGGTFAKSGAQTSFSWSSPQPLGGLSAATTYTVYGGAKSDLASLLNSNPDSCIVVVTSSTTAVIPGNPPAGGLAWYLVRATNACGQGTAGDTTVGPRIQDVRSCDDGIACTADSCDGSACIHTPVDASCDDANPCTDDTCNPVSGCGYANNAAPCDDGSLCTTLDTCSTGTCVGTTPGLASHLVISQIQMSGDGATPSDDEFVEIYNPTSSTIGLGGLSLQYKSALGSTYLVHQFGGAVGGVPPHRWFLVARSAYNGSVPADQVTSSFLMSATGGHVFLVNGTTALSGACSTSASIIDKVGYGTGNCPEGTAIAVPGANNSILRKPAAGCGNGKDSDNNAADFLSQVPSTPRNRSSPQEP